jgi:hypothetical protein
MGWSRDDHDIRFIVQLVASGTLPGRWWEHCRQGQDLERLCSTGYRLMVWLRYMYRYTTSTHMCSQWQRVTGFYWVQVLEKACARRVREIHITTVDAEYGTVPASHLIHSRMSPSSAQRILSSSTTSERIQASHATPLRVLGRLSLAPADLSASAQSVASSLVSSAAAPAAALAVQPTTSTDFRRDRDVTPQRLRPRHRIGRG